LGHHKEHHVHRIVCILDEIWVIGETLPLKVLVALKPDRRILLVIKLCFTLADVESNMVWKDWSLEEDFDTGFVRLHTIDSPSDPTLLPHV